MDIDTVARKLNKMKMTHTLPLPLPLPLYVGHNGTVHVLPLSLKTH